VKSSKNPYNAKAAKDAKIAKKIKNTQENIE